MEQENIFVVHFQGLSLIEHGVWGSSIQARVNE